VDFNEAPSLLVVGAHPTSPPFFSWGGMFGFLPAACRYSIAPVVNLHLHAFFFRRISTLRDKCVCTGRGRFVRWRLVRGGFKVLFLPRGGLSFRAMFVGQAFCGWRTLVFGRFFQDGSCSFSACPVTPGISSNQGGRPRPPVLFFFLGYVAFPPGSLAFPSSTPMGPALCPSLVTVLFSPLSFSRANGLLWTAGFGVPGCPRLSRLFRLFCV